MGDFDIYELSEMYMHTSTTFEDIQERCKKYEKDEKYVYKACNNGEGEQRVWIVIMEKCKEDTKTNEERKDVANKNRAKFRANKLMVVEIINYDDIKTKTTFIVNTTDYGKPLRYEVGKIVECDQFDDDVNVVCGGGIHYFKTLQAACYYGPYRRVRETGRYCFMSWHHNGRKQCEINYNDGVLDGSWVTFHESGGVRDMRTYKKGHIHGWLTEWHRNGEKSIEERYEDGILEGPHYKWYDNGKKHTHGFYKNGFAHGLWRHWNENGRKLMEIRYDMGKEHSHHYFV